MFQTNQWLPTSTTSKAVSPFTIHLQKDHKSEIKSCTIDIAQNEVSIRGSCNTYYGTNMQKKVQRAIKQ